MSKAIGMVEYKTVSAGVVAADAMVKTSDISVIEAQTVCPGKYIVIITGDLSAVDAAVNTAKVQHEDHLISSFVLGNPHESIFPAIYGATEIEEVSALGIIETYDAASMIVAADEAAKTAIVDLVELRLARRTQIRHIATKHFIRIGLYIYPTQIQPVIGRIDRLYICPPVFLVFQRG